MKAITKYIADDRTEFALETECALYEEQCEAVRLAIEPLRERPWLPECGFANGAGYLQHDPPPWRRCAMTCSTSPVARSVDTSGDQTQANPNAHPSWVGRLIDDSGHRALSEAWYRVMCIDDQGREWGQPYFANNPLAAAQVELQPGEQPE